MRVLLLLLLIAGAAYFTVPTREAHEAAARAFLQGHQPGEGPNDGLSLDDVINFAKGMFAGQGRYETFYVVSRYTVDMPGAAYLECYGAFTVVRCQEAGSGPAS
ncbi:MAG: hypothetical protein AB7O98_17100 [Hyphomonadaceae bacterium]